jgi:hypothetical protein
MRVNRGFSGCGLRTAPSCKAAHICEAAYEITASAVDADQKRGNSPVSKGCWSERRLCEWPNSGGVWSAQLKEDT